MAYPETEQRGAASLGAGREIGANQGGGKGGEQVGKGGRKRGEP